VGHAARSHFYIRVYQQKYIKLDIPDKTILSFPASIDCFYVGIVALKKFLPSDGKKSALSASASAYKVQPHAWRLAK
jgi:hypothetical protein